MKKYRIHGSDGCYKIQVKGWFSWNDVYTPYVHEVWNSKYTSMHTAISSRQEILRTLDDANKLLEFFQSRIIIYKNCTIEKVKYLVDTQYKKLSKDHAYVVTSTYYHSIHDMGLAEIFAERYYFSPTNSLELLKAAIDKDVFNLYTKKKHYR